MKVKQEKIIIGYTKQWISISGQNNDNPLLLILHGGPGEPLSSKMLHELLPDLEKYFVLVNWHQRNAGRSYNFTFSFKNLTVDQLVSDAIELSRHLLERFSRKRLLLLGGSWGSFLGISTIAKAPELYYAFVGIGQVVHQEEGEKISYDYILQKAIASNDEKTLKTLKRIGRPPYSSKKHILSLIKQRKLLHQYGGAIYNYSNFERASRISSKDYNIIDKLRILLGNYFSEKYLGHSFRKIDLGKECDNLDIPIFFIQGKHDWQTPTVLVKQYFKSLEARQKELFIFEKSGHLPAFEEPQKFTQVIRERVLPICKDNM